MPCSDWVLKLSARHQHDLSPADRQALNDHLASCPACNHVHLAYKRLGTDLHCLSSVRPIPEFSFEPAQIRQRPSSLSERSLFARVLAALSSLHLRLSWSPLEHAILTAFLLALLTFPGKVAYARSGNRFLYALRADSGFLLWKLKRYRRSELVSSHPIRLSGTVFVGSGIALVTALDFCKRAVQA